jgi:2-dehydropantoate 2-reductase
MPRRGIANDRMLRMRIAILGSGGLGAYFGGRLAAGGTDVAFLARGAHLAALRTNGLRIESPKGDLHLPKVVATDNPGEIGPVDVVLFTVKLYDTASAVALLPKLLGAETAVIPLQNGVESVEVLSRSIARRHLVGGTAYIQAAISEPGVIRHLGLDLIIFGELDGARSDRLERLFTACRDAGLSPKLTDQIDVEVWTKFVHITGMSGMTSVTRSPVGALRDDPDLRAMWEAALLESIAVARAKGIHLPDALATELMTLVGQLPPTARSSMLADLEANRRLELPWLSGAIVRLGHEVSVPTPVHRFITTVLKPHVHGNGK